jgi:predicted transcriptional regulator of viral defense system
MRLPEQGRYVFTLREAEVHAEGGRKAVQATLRRLKERGAIVCPRRGFYVLVPPEYRSAGCPPASWFIDDLMKNQGRGYYVALLTAAALHGAGHQQPMVFQVMTDASERDIRAGRVRIEYHVSRLVHAAATTGVQTETGTMVVATPETTAFDLVRFPGASGGWSHVATVLTELTESMDPARLVAGALRVPRAAVQRLGWMLDALGASALVEGLAEALEGQRLVPTPLEASEDASGAPLDPRWRILENVAVEPDL